MAAVRLLTVRYSHFCDKARWALDRAKLAFDEREHVPVLSWGATFGARGRRTVPVLVTPEGTLSDSTEILHWVDRQGGAPPLFPGDPEVVTLEGQFDRRLGPATRRLAYHALFTDPAATRAFVLSTGPAWERKVAGALFGGLRALIQRGLGVTDDGAARSRVVLDEVFAQCGARLADGRRYLCGDLFTAADLTFAALALPVLLPDDFRARFLPDMHIPPALDDVLARYRDTPAGRWAIALYQRERFATH